MHRSLSTAVALALFGAGVTPTHALAQTIRIPTAGKSAGQISDEIRAAAREVCWASYNNSMPISLTVYGACVSDQIRSAKAQLKGGASYAKLANDAILR